MNVDQQEVSALERHVGDQATSPLFAKLAALYLASDRAKDALRICDAGLANFPFYSTGHLIKGKALLQLGLNGEARREFEFVRDWLPTNPTVADLLASVPMSDDQVLEAAPAGEMQPEAAVEEPGEQTPEAQFGSSDEQAGSDLFGGMTPGVAPETAVEEFPEQPTETPQEDNVFGLPSELPAEPSSEEAGAGEDASPESAFGGMEAFAQFGGGDTSAPGSMAGEEIPAPESGLEAMFGGGASAAPAIEDDFDIYAARKRGDLGPTDVITFEEYLASPSPQAEDLGGGSAPEDSAPADDPFAAAGFQTTTEASGQEETATEEPMPQDFGGFGGEASAESFGETASEEKPTDETGFGSGEEVSEEPVGEQDLSAYLAEQATEETSSFESSQEEQGPAPESTGDQTFEGFGAAETAESSEGPSPVGEEMFAGFGSAGETTEEPQTETETPAFPDFSGLPGFEGPDLTPADDTGAAEEETSEEGFVGPAFEEPEPPRSAGDKIGEFAEKLQEAKKITPVIDLTTQITSSTPSNADETAVDAGFVTPTLAEIYAKQGWYDDAINAYKTLAKSRPAEKEKFEQRVKELEEEKAKAD